MLDDSRFDDGVPLMQQMQIGYTASAVARTTTTDQLARWQDESLVVTGGVSGGATLVLTVIDEDEKGAGDFLGQASRPCDKRLRCVVLARLLLRFCRTVPSSARRVSL
jgi:hypothetical protein